MFFDFLQDRAAEKEAKVTATLLDNISIAGQKVEELVKNLYRHMDKVGADAIIDIVEKRVIAKEFFKNFFNSWFLNHIERDYTQYFIDTPREGQWYQYIAKAMSARIMHSKYDVIFSLIYSQNKMLSIYVDSEEDSETAKKHRLQQERFEVVKQLSNKELEEVLRELDLFKDVQKKNKEKEL